MLASAMTLGSALMLVFASVQSQPPLDLATPAQPPQPILGGERTGPGEFDGVVAVLAGSGFCTGTVVAPRLVLTAGHCLRDVPPTGVTVLFGDEINVSMTIPAESWGVHPEFCSDCKDDIFDYGYVTLGTNFNVPGGYLLPIVDQDEWNSTIVPGGEVTLVGYGEDPAEDDSIGIKRKVSTFIHRISPKGLEFFAGGDGRDSCHGDSGGPAFVQLPNGTLRLAGITSRGSAPCGSGGYYGTPFASLCWVRDETGVDLLPPACTSCDCLEMVPPEDGCSIAPRGSKRSLALGGLLFVLIAGRRRRSRVCS